MKLYTHYKNKPYKYIGLARHSETQEEMVIYETCYECEGGSLWIRPKDMFFESVTVNNEQVPRFKKAPLAIKQSAPVSKEDVNTIAPLIEKIFGEWDSDWFYSKFNSQKNTHLIVAFVDDQAVGFKLGYELSSTKFYSWLGGIVPEFRGLGVASELMKAQHEWCKRSGYKTVQTKTQNRFREMLLLNIRYGFDVIGIQSSEEGDLKIVLEKKL